ncbi:hypothetical protein M9Y10_044948 [Tritrichomonas musculus]|uniref:Cornichon protein n=1 Tax=Tritrichomonas musculus TaxID=1915356 RepID=A0ABR2JV33_9EUKA
MSYHFSILQRLVNFQLDQTSPIDLCIDLEKNVLPITVSNCAVIFLSLFMFKSDWPIFFAYLFMLLYTFHLKERAKSKKSQIFDPVTIVRDIDSIKIRHVIALSVSLFLAIFGLIKIILILT